MTEFLQISSYALLAYYCSINLVYLILLAESVAATLTYQRLVKTLWHDHLRSSHRTPPISILVPARNEAKSIAQSVRSLLRLDYPELEVIIVNGGHHRQ
jgi:cellulose synthase/poly-beta-1,6-N-acetylglucosamine synthase-like glycosyltransferase